VNRLVPFYAIGVFTAFSMAGFGMARYHHRHQEQGWRHKLVINFSAGVLTSIVVVVFAVVKFTEGAWLIVIIFPLMVFGLIKLNSRYREEAEVLEYLGGRKPPDPPELRAPHGAGLRGRVQPGDDRRAALRERAAAHRAARGPLRHRHRAGRRAARRMAPGGAPHPARPGGLPRPADSTGRPGELVAREASEPGTQVTVVLPRRSYAPLLGQLLHDQTADKIARVVSRIPRSAATILPFDEAGPHRGAARAPGHPEVHGPGPGREGARS
jgi:hypothetical protein